MKLQKYILNVNLKSRKTTLAGRKRGARERVKGSGATASANAIAPHLARNLRDKYFDGNMSLSSIN